MLTLTNLIFLAGISEILLALVSPVIPYLLNWKKELSTLKPLIRQIFWTYAVYILLINFCFGLLSTLFPASLCDGSFLAAVITLFIACYWIGRIFIQFFYFDRKSVPRKWIYQWGEIALVALFTFLSFVYAFAFYHNYLILKQ